MHIFKDACNICAQFQPYCLKPVGGVDYTNLPILKPNLKIAYVEKCVILIFFFYVQEFTCTYSIY